MHEIFPKVWDKDDQFSVIFSWCLEILWIPLQSLMTWTEFELSNPLQSAIIRGFSLGHPWFTLNLTPDVHNTLKLQKKVFDQNFSLSQTFLSNLVRTISPQVILISQPFSSQWKLSKITKLFFRKSNKKLCIEGEKKLFFSIWMKAIIEWREGWNNSHFTQQDKNRFRKKGKILLSWMFELVCSKWKSNFLPV